MASECVIYININYMNKLKVFRATNVLLQNSSYNKYAPSRTFDDVPRVSGPD